MSIYAVRSEFASQSAAQLLTHPVQALVGVSEDGFKILSSLGIATIFDLAASSIFDSARQVVFAAAQSTGIGTDRVAGDFVDSKYRERSPKAVAVAPLSAMRSIGEATAQKIKNSLGVDTIEELANWSPYRAARLILNDVHGMSAPIVDDPERPDDLIPVSRRYATERVQYDIIVMDKVIEEAQPFPVTHVAPPTAPPKNLLQEGAIDISDIVSAALVARPAIGAVLTYRQSWFPQGLALGHLLHSMALAPGEVTRIAMVDWTRRTRARADDDTTQTESLINDLSRNRAMSEVTKAVAKEAQSGFSGSTSEAHQNQRGESGGSAGISGLGALGVLGLLGIGEAPTISSRGTSSARSDSSTTASIETPHQDIISHPANSIQWQIVTGHLGVFYI